MASISISSQVWTGASYTINFSFSWNVTTDDSTLNIYEYHGKENVLNISIPSGNIIWNDVASNTAEIAGFVPYMKYIATFANQTLSFNVNPHPNHVSDSYYPTYYPTMQTQMYQYDFNAFSVRGETGCCVPSTLVAVREKIEHDIRPNSTRKYSSSWIYGAVSTSATEWGGMYTGDALDFLTSVGVPTYKKIKVYGVKNYPDVYAKQSFSTSYNGVSETALGAVQRYNKITGSKYAQYGRIASWNKTSITNVVEIMNYVSGNMTSACLDIVITEEFDSACKNTSGQKGVVPRLNQYSTERGGHCMIILGWKKINGEYHWICQNSWGRKYPFNTTWWDSANWSEVGDNGLIYVPFSYHARVQNNIVNGGVYGVYLVSGMDCGTDEFSWDTPKVKGQPFNLTKSEWDKLQNYINECLEYVNKSPYSFTVATRGQPLTWTHYNEIRSAVNYSVYLGSSISIPFALKGDQIKADEHLNKLVESLNSVT